MAQTVIVAGAALTPINRTLPDSWLQQLLLKMFRRLLHMLH
jgi:hypothetical protein